MRTHGHKWSRRDDKKMELQQCEVIAHHSFDLPIPLEWSSSKQSQTKAGEIVERREPSYTIGKNVKVQKPPRRTVRKFLTKLK